MTRLATMFDGEIHELESGVDFYRTAFLVLKGFEEEELDDEPTQWESESLVPITTKDDFSHITIEGFEMEHGWGVFAMAMNNVCRVLGVKKEMYQHNNWPTNPQKGESNRPERHFTFKMKAEEDGSGYQGGRL